MLEKNDVLDRMLMVCGSWRQGEIFHLKLSEKGKEHCLKKKKFPLRTGEAAQSFTTC